MLVDNPYYYRMRGQTVGPLSIEQIQQRVATGRLGKRTAVSRDGQSWRVAEEFPELFADLSPPFGNPAPAGVQPAAEIWSFQSLEGRRGEGDADTIRQMVQMGELTHDDRVWRVGMQKWLPIGAVPALSGRSTPEKTRSKYIAAILAFFLGGLGIHHFYLGNTGLGIIYLLFCWTLIPAIVALVEGIVFLVIPEPDFDSRYNS
jgi:TM2 domain-containing membrane protein YozV